MPLAALRRTLLPAVVAAAAFLGAATAGAQSLDVTATYAPSCGPSTSCTLLRFNLGNLGGAPLLLNTLTVSSVNPAFRFAPSAGGVALYQAVDGVGPFGGTGTVAPGGAQLFIDFLGGNGFAFELPVAATGYVEVPLTATPAVGGAAFNLSATLADGGTVAATTTPEPATVALLGGGLALIGLAARRRRRA